MSYVLTAQRHLEGKRFSIISVGCQLKLVLEIHYLRVFRF